MPAAAQQRLFVSIVSTLPAARSKAGRALVLSCWFCKGKVMVSINDHPDIRRVFEGFHFETVDIRYSTSNQRQGKAEVSGELVIMNWEPAALGGLF